MHTYLCNCVIIISVVTAGVFRGVRFPVDKKWRSMVTPSNWNMMLDIVTVWGLIMLSLNRFRDVVHVARGGQTFCLFGRGEKRGLEDNTNMAFEIKDVTWQLWKCYKILATQWWLNMLESQLICLHTAMSWISATLPNYKCSKKINWYRKTDSF